MMGSGSILRRVTRALLVLAVNLLVVALVLLAFERLFSPYRGLPRNGRFDGILYTWGHRVRNNRHGFRERDFATPKPAGVRRVMVLGDSLTWGAGLAAEERCTAVAQRILGDGFEVLNFGLAGGATTSERDVLLQFAGIVDPDLVVVGFCLNDPQPRGQDWSVERESLDEGAAGRLVRRVVKELRSGGLVFAGALVERGFYRAAEALGLIPPWPEALDRTYEPASPEWREFTGALEDIRRKCDERGLPRPLFAVLNQGTYVDRPTDYGHPDELLKRFLKWYDQAKRAARRAGFDAYDHVGDIARELGDEPLSVNAVDGHPSAALNRIYGIKLAGEIAERLPDSEREGGASCPR